MGEQLGPEAKKKVDETWKQIKDILEGGVTPLAVDQLQRLIQDKIQELRKMSDQAWQKGFEQAKPFLERNPKLKELLEQNKDQLMQGNVVELWQKVQDAARSGDTSDTERFVRETVDKAKATASGSGGMEQFLTAIPGGSEVVPTLKQLQEFAEKHGDEAQKLMKDAFKEVQDVLTRKVEEAKKLMDKASKDAKW
jgi:hypothetical protein